MNETLHMDNVYLVNNDYGSIFLKETDPLSALKLVAFGNCTIREDFGDAIQEHVSTLIDFVSSRCEAKKKGSKQDMIDAIVKVLRGD